LRRHSNAEVMTLRAVIGLAVAIALVLPFLATGCGGGTSTPQAAVDSFLKAIENNDWNAYVGSVLPDNVRRMTDADTKDRKAQFKNIKETHKGMKFKVEYDKKDKNKATVTITAGTIATSDKKSGQKQSMTIAEYKKTTGQYPSIPAEKFKGSWYVNVPMASSDVPPQTQQAPQEAPQPSEAPSPEQGSTPAP